jgi:hypothetical protein
MQGLSQFTQIGIFGSKECHLAALLRHWRSCTIESRQNLIAVVPFHRSLTRRTKLPFRFLGVERRWGFLTTWIIQKMYHLAVFIGLLCTIITTQLECFSSSMYLCSSGLGEIRAVK